MTWLRKKSIPAFAPRGDEVIGNTQQGQAVNISQEFWRWLSLLATRLQNNVAAPGTIQMTAAAVEPEGWLFLNGQAVDASLYPDLANVFGSSGGIITLPDYSNRIAMGAGSIVALNDTAGAETVTLTIDEMPQHNHDVLDPGHSHGAIDRGHVHGLQLDSHSHGATESEHTHTITDPGHFHSSGEEVSAVNVAAGSDFLSAIDGSTTTETTGITIDPASTGLEVDEAEVTGQVLKSRADIRVGVSRAGIETMDAGKGQPFSIIPPVFGVNWMVKI